jgi:hypothetical protein
MQLILRIQQPGGYYQSRWLVSHPVEAAETAEGS